MKKQDFYHLGEVYHVSQEISTLFLQKITGLSKAQLFLTDEILEGYDTFESYLLRYTQGEPLEYILQKATFFSLDFFVDNRVLIPRNDTEIMVESVLKFLQDSQKYTLIDVGTGSACIPISICKNTHAIVSSYAVDISQQALEIANKNIKIHDCTYIKTYFSDLLDFLNFSDNLNISNNLIITANLPYIKNNDFENMDISTYTFEPSLALYGGKKTGFELYEKLIIQCKNIYLKYPHLDSITLFIEIGFDQYEYSQQYLANAGLKCEFYEDNSGIKRCVKIEFVN